MDFRVKNLVTGWINFNDRFDRFSITVFKSAVSLMWFWSVFFITKLTASASFPPKTFSKVLRALCPWRDLLLPVGATIFELENLSSPLQDWIPWNIWSKKIRTKQKAQTNVEDILQLKNFIEGTLKWNIRISENH